MELERIELSCSIISPQMNTCLAQVVILRFIFAESFELKEVKNLLIVLKSLV